MVLKNNGNRLGAWTFLIGALIALVFGLFGALTSFLAALLVIIGFIVGILNIADDEVEPFLLSGTVLIIAATFGQQAVGILPVFERILDSLLLIFIPATIVVAIKNVFSLARR
ncbi:hypothetical protein HYZ97_04925 [Candidatus Pacearchaeota archaeon]|nr:hypothetical protein [Candidatus Pacearchaeota archaeon]